MTPEQITAITAIVALLEKIGVWPILSFLGLIILVPWVSNIYLSRIQEKRIADGERRFQEMKQMYENNIVLVKNYEKMTTSLEKIVEGLIDLVSLNTVQWAEVKEKIDTNQFCPSHRTMKIKSENVQS